MRLYHSRSYQPMKWVVAMIVFALAMSITFSNVYGFGRDTNTRPGDHGGKHRPGDGTHNGGNNGGNTGGGDNGGTDNPSPTSVPEPGTLVLLAGGLSALYVARRMKK